MSGYTSEDCGFCRSDHKRKRRGTFRAAWRANRHAALDTVLYWCTAHTAEALAWLRAEGHEKQLTRTETLALDATWVPVTLAETAVQ